MIPFAILVDYFKDCVYTKRIGRIELPKTNLMKIRFITSLLPTAFALTGYAQCNNPFYPMEKDHYHEVEVYDRKDKLQTTGQCTSRRWKKPTMATRPP